MVEMGGPSYYDEEERPRRRQGRVFWAFVLGALFGLGIGFWAGRGLDMGVMPSDVGWIATAIIPLTILLVVMVRLRDRPRHESRSPEQVRGFMLVLVGLVLAIALALVMLLGLGK